MGNRPTHFEIPVDDPDRAEKFYTDAFGWSFNRFEGSPSYYGLADTGDESERGINGALYARGDMTTTMLTVSVDSIEDAEAKILAAGGTVVTPKSPIPGMGYFAQYKDTEGNIVGTYKDDDSATM